MRINLISQSQSATEFIKFYRYFILKIAYNELRVDIVRSVYRFWCLHKSLRHHMWHDRNKSHIFRRNMSLVCRDEFHNFYAPTGGSVKKFSMCYFCEIILSFTSNFDGDIRIKQRMRCMCVSMSGEVWRERWRFSSSANVDMKYPSA